MPAAFTRRLSNQRPGASSWHELAREDASLATAAAVMRCSPATAAKRLDQARRSLDRLPTTRQSAAVAVLMASGVVRQDISRRRWQDVLLGHLPHG